jgi:hypothetical protein
MGVAARARFDTPSFGSRLAHYGKDALPAAPTCATSTYGCSLEAAPASTRCRISLTPPLPNAGSVCHNVAAVRIVRRRCAPDEDLAAAAQRGDGDAFGELYRRHVVAITTFMRRRSSSSDLA